MMTTETTRAIVQRLMNEKETIGVFDLVLRGGDGAADVLLAFRENPQAALQAIDRGFTTDDAQGFDTKRIADTLELVLGEVPDAAVARQLLADHVRPERAVELLVARGDLDAVAADVSDLDLIQAAILTEVLTAAGELSRINQIFAAYNNAADARNLPSREALEIDEEDAEDLALEEAETEAELDREPTEAELKKAVDLRPAVTKANADEDAESPREGSSTKSKPLDLSSLFSWARKLKERKDFSQFLECEIAGRTIYDHLLALLWLEHEGNEDDPQESTRDVFEDLGLDWAESVQRQQIVVDDLDLFQDVSADELVLDLDECYSRLKRNAPVVTHDRAREETLSAVHAAKDLI